MWRFGKVGVDWGVARNPPANVDEIAPVRRLGRARTKSTSEVEQIGKRAGSLRPSVSSASLKYAPQPSGLRILSPSALSQSSSVLAQGQLFPLPQDQAVYPAQAQSPSQPRDEVSMPPEEPSDLTRAQQEKTPTNDTSPSEPADKSPATECSKTVPEASVESPAGQRHTGESEPTPTLGDEPDNVGENRGHDQASTSNKTAEPIAEDSSLLVVQKPRSRLPARSPESYAPRAVPIVYAVPSSLKKVSERTWIATTAIAATPSDFSTRYPDPVSTDQGISPEQHPLKDPDPSGISSKGPSAALANLQSIAHASAIPTSHPQRSTGSEDFPITASSTTVKQTEAQAIAEVLQASTVNIPRKTSTVSSRMTFSNIEPIQEVSSEDLPDSSSERPRRRSSTFESGRPAGPAPLQVQSGETRDENTSSGRKASLPHATSVKESDPKTPSNRQPSGTSKASDRSKVSALSNYDGPATTIQRVTTAIGNALAWTALPGVGSGRKTSSDANMPAPPVPESGPPAIGRSVSAPDGVKSQKAASAPGFSSLRGTSALPGPSTVPAPSEYAATIAVLPTPAVPAGGALLVDSQTISNQMQGQLHVLPTSIEIPEHLQPVLAAIPDLPADQVVPLLNGSLPIPSLPKPSIRQAVKFKVRKGVVMHLLNILLGKQVAGVTKPVLQNLPQPSVRVAIKSKFTRKKKGLPVIGDVGAGVEAGVGAVGAGVGAVGAGVGTAGAGALNSGRRMC